MRARRTCVVNPSNYPAALVQSDCGIVRAVNSAFLVKVLKNNDLSLDFFCKVLINKD